MIESADESRVVFMNVKPERPSPESRRNAMEQRLVGGRHKLVVLVEKVDFFSGFWLES